MQNVLNVNHSLSRHEKSHITLPHKHELHYNVGHFHSLSKYIYMSIWILYIKILSLTLCRLPVEQNWGYVILTYKTYASHSTEDSVYIMVITVLGARLARNSAYGYLMLFYIYKRPQFSHGLFWACLLHIMLEDFISIPILLFSCHGSRALLQTLQFPSSQHWCTCFLPYKWDNKCAILSHLLSHYRCQRELIGGYAFCLTP